MRSLPNQAHKVCDPLGHCLNVICRSSNPPNRQILPIRRDDDAHHESARDPDQGLQYKPHRARRPKLYDVDHEFETAIGTRRCLRSDECFEFIEP
jgi:hypothetical protein